MSLGVMIPQNPNMNPQMSNMSPQFKYKKSWGEGWKWVVGVRWGMCLDDVA
jgi:hypothetical protein